MRRNFQFDGMTVVRWGDKFIDLHNAYTITGLGTDLSGDQVELRFRRNSYAINPESLPLDVSLRCSGNVRVAFNDLCAIAAPIEAEGIEIAYFDEDCDWLSFLDEEIARRQEPRGLHLSFANGLAVRIFCDEAMFAVK